MEVLKLDNSERSKILRQKTKRVEIFDKNLKELINSMKKILIKYGGLGIAANQVGIDLSIFIAKPKDKFYVFINPELIEGKNETIKEEGCLSIDNLWGLVKRFEEIKIKYQNIEGKTKTLKAKGLLAHIIQHEIDHLNGILFIDKAIEIYKISENGKEA